MIQVEPLFSINIIINYANTFLSHNLLYFMVNIYV